MMFIARITFYILLVVAAGRVAAQQWKGKFEQLGPGEIPTPNRYRSASGAPGPDYWQQRADYVIEAEVNDNTQELTGKETITYYNNSPDVLNYLWLQLDENQHSTVNNANYQTQNPMPANNQSTDKVLDRYEERRTDNGYGFNITKLTDIAGKPLKYYINKTMMKV